MRDQNPMTLLTLSPPATLSAFCTLLTKSGQIDKALSVLKDQATGQRRLTSSFTEPLIKLLSEAKRYDDIFDLLKMLASWHLTPPKLIFEILLPKAAESGSNEQLHVMLQSLRDPNRPAQEGPSIWVYNSTLIALAKRKDLHWFNKIVKYMRKRNIAFNPLTFAVHVVCLLRCDKQLEAQQLTADMSRRRISREQIIASYRDAIVVFGRSGRVDYIEDMLDHLDLLSYPPTAETFQVILLVYAKLNMEKELLNMLERMFERWGVVPDTSCVNQLLLLHSFRGNVAEAEDIFRLLRDPEFPDRKPDPFSYRYLISTYGRGGKIREAFAYFEEMTKDAKIWGSVFFKVAYDFTVNVLQHNQILPKGTLDAAMKKWNRPPIKSTARLSPKERDELLSDFHLWKSMLKSPS
jgi:pentatricopeptide repeat protein